MVDIGSCCIYQQLSRGVPYNVPVGEAIQASEVVRIGAAIAPTIFGIFRRCLSFLPTRPLEDTSSSILACRERIGPDNQQYECRIVCSIITQTKRRTRLIGTATQHNQTEWQYIARRVKRNVCSGFLSEFTRVYVHRCVDTHTAYPLLPSQFRPSSRSVRKSCKTERFDAIQHLNSGMYMYRCVCV